MRRIRCTVPLGFKKSIRIPTTVWSHTNRPNSLINTIPSRCSWNWICRPASSPPTHSLRQEARISCPSLQAP